MRARGAIRFTDVITGSPFAAPRPGNFCARFRPILTRFCGEFALWLPIALLTASPWHTLSAINHNESDLQSSRRLFALSDSPASAENCSLVVLVPYLRHWGRALRLGCLSQPSRLPVALRFGSAPAARFRFWRRYPPVSCRTGRGLHTRAFLHEFLTTPSLREIFFFHYFTYCTASQLLERDELSYPWQAEDPHYQAPVRPVNLAVAKWRPPGLELVLTRATS
ncbi:hypothetical protein R3P38DRAFT_3204340 [Favolaschia claudopus]|uniref:Uncharacterized protein n=1 Tax=Favolaschia claudopus TaxID=2862362 RepID=A0AAW0ARZ4_9AGAR